ncbi:uncharacterized protein LY89DRAFT_678429 [Mollisia scopiformis]|uniref:Uncharacterized protein n=1 Tax=Mollisia scopiformis TaxID=149040 RepID=A0A132B379_MOLSC|nr:uncharacterized protein LY89DRAFT_678429 [Mollisia scopiformis]KUJ06850.1 hypothetical protein LY89DRAFT_678429 [Mollisia scopiformis]
MDNLTEETAKRRIVNLVRIYAWCLSKDQIKILTQQARKFTESPGFPESLQECRQNLRNTLDLIEQEIKEESPPRSTSEDPVVEGDAEVVGAAASLDEVFNGVDPRSSTMLESLESLNGLDISHLLNHSRANQSYPFRYLKQRHPYYPITDLEEVETLLSTRTGVTGMRGGLITDHDEEREGLQEEEDEEEEEWGDVDAGQGGEAEEEDGRNEEQATSEDEDWVKKVGKTSSRIYDTTYGREIEAQHGVIIQILILIASMEVPHLITIVNLMWQRLCRENAPSEFFPHREAMFLLLKSIRVTLDRYKNESETAALIRDGI